MQIGEVGEFGLIERIGRLARRVQGRQVALGIGDDAALLRTRPGEELVLSVDALVEDVHFRFGREAARDVGRRALVAALSDLAAMGARPLGSLLALAAPPSLELRSALDLVRGLLDLGARTGCPLAGGNVARASETSLTVTVAGATPRGRALRRAGARPGDRILVTGVLGASALARARADQEGSRLRRVPEPRLAAGQALRRLSGVGACIDVSDGLLADLRHLLDASGTGAELDAARVPRPRGFAAACRRLGLDPDALALAGGEDYELLFTVRRPSLDAATLTRSLRLPVTEIGRITRSGLRVEGATLSEGWTHF